jgi:hypothetical protein
VIPEFDTFFTKSYDFATVFYRIEHCKSTAGLPHRLPISAAVTASAPLGEELMHTKLSSEIGLPRLRAVAALVALSCSCGASLATDATVVVTSFSYVTSIGDLTWSNPNQSFQTIATNGGGISRSDSFATPDYGFLAVGANTSNAVAAVSTTSPQTFFVSAATTPSAGPEGTPRNQASASATQSGSFMLSEAGSVTFTVGYLLTASAPGGSALTESSTSLLTFGVSGGTGGGSLRDELLSFSQQSGVGSKPGQFNLTVNLTPTQMGSYNLAGSATSFSIAAIPEPTDFALMTGGMVAMGLFLRRRRSARP